MLAALATLLAAPVSAQTPGQPPFEACKPGGFTVVGFPEEFGPQPDSRFTVAIDERFNGGFLTTQRIWLGPILATIEKWNAVAGSTWRFNAVGLTSEDPSADDGVLTIAACGFTFGCPDGPPPTPPPGPGGGVIDFFPDTLAAYQTTLAVTLISEDNGVGRTIRDADIFFNPNIPFEVNPNDGQIDFETVLLHELGHTLGLGHNDNCGAGNTVMRSVVDLNERKRQLAASETEGAKFLYPPDSDPAVRIFERDRSLRFDAQEGRLPPFGREVNVYGLRHHRWLASAATEDGAAWLWSDPPAGHFGSTDELEVVVDHSALAPGDYRGTISIRDEAKSGPSTTIAVTLRVEPKRSQDRLPMLTSEGIVNGANLLSRRIAPGSLVTLFGENLATTTMQAAAFPLPTNLGGSEVVINGVKASLLYVSPNQVNAVVPPETSAGRGGLVVRNGLGQDRGTPVELLSAAPELFLLDNQWALALNQDGSLNTPENPASPGSVVTVFLTGIGRVDPPVAGGLPASSTELSRAVAPHEAFVAGKSCTVHFLGLTPDFAGLAQANLETPENITGDLPVKVVVDGRESNLALISVR